MTSKDLGRALRATLWPALKAHGFRDRTERVAWRYTDADIDVVELQTVGQAAEQVGCPPLSLSAFVASYPSFVASYPPFRELTTRLPLRDGRPRPRYWHCDPFRTTLRKTLAQPWFRPFSEPRDHRTLPSFRLHREALMKLVRMDTHDVADIWYMRDDGSNLDQNLLDLTAVVLSAGLDLLDRYHDPVEARRMIESGVLLKASAPRAAELLAAIEHALAKERSP